MLADQRSFERVEFRQRRQAEGRGLALPVLGLMG
jgi:hypothetical protein